MSRLDSEDKSLKWKQKFLKNDRRFQNTKSFPERESYKRRKR